MTSEVSTLVSDWPEFLITGVLVMIRLSGIVMFAPLFSSVAIAPRIKVGFVIAMTLLLSPAVTTLPNMRISLDARSVLSELGVGLMLGLSLMLLSEALMFAGMLLGMQFSFSLVNLMDPNSRIETPVLGQMLNWLGLLVIIGSGLDRSLLAAVVRSFRVVPVGQALIEAKTGSALAAMAGGIFLAGLQLAAPVIAAALTVEITISLIGRLSPQLPAMVMSIPLKTMVSYIVLIGSLAVWPEWIDQHFSALLDAAGRLMVAK
jgi:flagellar biosynthetic protein FliR